MFPLAHFLRQELRDAPGRASYTLRLTLSCAVLITLFMTLQIPFLAVALIVVFYVSQPNVLMIKLVSVVFFVTVTVALGGVLLIIKWTYDYPLIRLAASVALFFCAIYLMRVLGKLGLAFFVVALAVIYAQTFPSMTSQSEILVRLLLWLWVAINTAILVTLLVNACFQQAFPGNQFKARLAGMLHEVARRLTAPGDEAPPTFGETAAQFNQLQSLFAQASRATPEIAAEPQAWRSRLAATLRCYQLAALLQADEADSDDRQQLSQAVLKLKSALSEEQFDGAIPPLALSGRGINHAVLQEMATLLQQLAQGEPVALPQGEVEKAPLLAPDAWRNPAYLHFALKTLLATLICYVFYTAADWQGLHTIMLSCVIVAQPGLGATMQKTWLRIGGALLATLLAVLLLALRLGGGRAGRGLVAAWVSLFRNTPLLVQLLFWYFAAWNLLPLAVKEVVNDEHAWSILPGNVWWLTPEFLCSMWGLGVFTSAFLVEEIASGLRAVSHGQREAALSQGFTPWQELRFILLPQGLANAWQPIVGQYLNLMKLSSLASGIGFAELTYQVRQIESYNAHALEAFAVGTALYLALGVAMGVALTRLGPGRKLQRSAQHER